LVQVTIPLIGKIDLHIHYIILLLTVIPFGRIMGLLGACVLHGKDVEILAALRGWLPLSCITLKCARIKRVSDTVTNGSVDITLRLMMESAGEESKAGAVSCTHLYIILSTMPRFAVHVRYARL
jgi:hypothetical protein